MVWGRGSSQCVFIGNNFRAVDLKCQKGPVKRKKKMKREFEVFLKSDPWVKDFIMELRNQYD